MPNDDRRDACRYEIDRFSPTRGRPSAGRRCPEGAPRPAEPRLPLAPPAAGPHAPPDGDADDVTGDAGRLLAAFQPHAAAVYRVAHRITGSAADAEEVRQEVFLTLFRRPPACLADPGAWLRRCAANAAVNRVRSHARRRARHAAHAEPPSAPPDPAAAAERSEEAARLRAALGRLPPEQRAIVALRYDGGLTFAEAAAALGVPVGTAKDRGRAALRRLRALLNEPEPSR